MYSADIHINLKGLDRFKKSVNDQLNGKAGPIANCIKLWAVRYRSFAQLRFDLYSRGGGDWAHLAVSTMKKRRKGTRKQSIVKFAILRDTGTLFTALTPLFIGSPGAIETKIPFGVRVGYGGPQRYTQESGKGSRATIADIASFHQAGVVPRLPKREIIVPPTRELMNTMADDMTKALHDAATGK